MSITIGMIDVTDVPLGALVRAAYSPSRAQGLGHFAFQAGDLSDEDVSEIIERGKSDPMCAIGMDYVHGRSVKFHVRRINGRLYINNSWYDHTDSELRSLLKAVGLSSDLIDSARAEKSAYDAECISAALAYLQANGPLIENRGRMTDDPLPEMVRAGLYAGKYSNPPKIKEHWADGESTWTTAEDTP